MSNDRDRPTVRFLDVKNFPRLQPDDFGGVVPAIDAREVVVLDHDQRECRIISEDEFIRFYLDNNIQRIAPINQALFLTPNNTIDDKDLHLEYHHGASLVLRLGDISLSHASRAHGFCKTNGIIFPVNRQGILMLDATNTPRLAAIRRDFNQQVQNLTAEMLELLNLGATFGLILKTNSSAF